MAFTTTFFCVTATTSPWTQEMKQTVGFYRGEQTARTVCDLIRTLNQHAHPGGVDVSIQAYEDVVIETQRGLRLQDTPAGRIIMIQGALDEEESKRLADFKLFSQEQRVVEIEV